MGWDLEAWKPAAAVVGFVLFWLWESFSPFRRFECRGRHLGRNLSIVAVNWMLAWVAPFYLLNLAAAEASQQTLMGLLHRAAASGWAAFIVGFLALDLWAYWWHRFSHVAPLLWRFHRMHHSDPTMDVSTATRFHVGELALSFVLRAALIFLIGVPVGAIFAYDAAQLLCTQFHHANIMLPAAADRALSWLLVSPNMHKLHHSVEQAEMDSNFTSVLTLWDRLFGTYRQREDCAAVAYGVPGMQDEAHQSVVGMLGTPLEPEAAVDRATG
ncbi:MAG: sterol desaturase family protein [Bryobacterales bacterium]|nr:sterol desaturase family protein [Acidobacteriota bacterium]MCB9383051.1 sterol desaturase family protein [Bryobacterales bacterium]